MCIKLQKQPVYDQHTHQCATWQTCMNRDPTVVGRAKVFAGLIAEVVNEHVEPISLKTFVSSFVTDSILES